MDGPRGHRQRICRLHVDGGRGGLRTRGAERQRHQGRLEGTRRQLLSRGSRTCTDHPDARPLTAALHPTFRPRKAATRAQRRRHSARGANVDLTATLAAVPSSYATSPATCRATARAPRWARAEAAACACVVARPACPASLLLTRRPAQRLPEQEVLASGRLQAGGRPVLCPHPALWLTGGGGCVTSPQQEDVWKREQAKAEEDKRLEELRKQINEEREHQELLRVAREAGHVLCVPCCLSVPRAPAALTHSTPAAPCTARRSDWSSCTRGRWQRARGWGAPRRPRRRQSSPPPRQKQRSRRLGRPTTHCQCMWTTRPGPATRRGRACMRTPCSWCATPASGATCVSLIV